MRVIKLVSLFDLTREITISKKITRSRYKGRMVDALALGADEGRG